MDTSEEKREQPKRIGWTETILWGVGAVASWNYLPWLFAVIPAHFEMPWQLDFTFMGRAVSTLVIAQAVRKLLNRLGVAQRFEAGIQNNWNKFRFLSFIGTGAVALGNGLLNAAVTYSAVGTFFNIPTPQTWQNLYLSSSLEDFFMYAAPIYVGLNTVASSVRARIPANERKWYWPDRIRRLVGYMGFNILAWHILNCMVQDVISNNTTWNNLYRAMAGWVAGGFALWLTWRSYRVGPGKLKFSFPVWKREKKKAREKEPMVAICKGCRKELGIPACPNCKSTDVALTCTVVFGPKALKQDNNVFCCRNCHYGSPLWGDVRHAEGYLWRTFPCEECGCINLASTFPFVLSTLAAIRDLFFGILGIHSE